PQGALAKFYDVSGSANDRGNLQFTLARGTPPRIRFNIESEVIQNGQSNMPSDRGTEAQADLRRILRSHFHRSARAKAQSARARLHITPVVQQQPGQRLVVAIEVEQ